MPLLPSRLFCSNEDEGEGFVLNGDGIGLRLTAMEYWKCGEAGMKFSFTDKKEPECKFVVAESLPGQGKTLLLLVCVCV
jgi:protocatechuate 3,4-dioxygenase beta subunit